MPRPATVRSSTTVSVKAPPAFKGPAGRAPGAVTRRGVTCRAGGHGLQPCAFAPHTLRRPSPLPTPFQNPSISATASPRGAPAGRSAVVQPPGTQPAPVTVPPKVPQPRRALHPQRAPPPGSQRSLRARGPPGQGRGGPRPRARTGAELPLGGRRRGHPSIPAAPPPRGLPPNPGPQLIPRRPPPNPHQAEEKKRGEKNAPNETLQLSQQQAEALLPTQMWGSFRDPSSGEFLGGTGRKPPTFHADRRLQTVCCSCNEILIFAPPFFFFLSLLFFFFPSGVCESRKLEQSGRAGSLPLLHYSPGGVQSV